MDLPGFIYQIESYLWGFLAVALAGAVFALFAKTRLGKSTTLKLMLIAVFAAMAPFAPSIILSATQTIFGDTRTGALERAKFDRFLKTDNGEVATLLRALRDGRPQLFEAWLSELSKAQTGEVPQHERLKTAQSIISRAVAEGFINAPDEIAIQSLRLSVDQVVLYRKVWPQACKKLWIGQPLGMPPQYVVKHPLMKMDLDLKVKVLTLERHQPRANMTDDELGKVFEVISRHMTKQGIDPSPLFEHKKLNDMTPAKICDTVYAFYNYSISALKPEWSAKLVRKLNHLAFSGDVSLEGNMN